MKSIPIKFRGKDVVSAEIYPCVHLKCYRLIKEKTNE